MADPAVLQLALGTPVVAAPITSVQLVSSHYDFRSNSISVVWQEMTADGSLAGQKTVRLSDDQVTAFFGTRLLGIPDLKTAFTVAFIAVVSSVYGTVTPVTA